MNYSEARALREDRFKIARQAQDVINNPRSTVEDIRSANKMLDEADLISVKIRAIEGDGAPPHSYLGDGRSSGVPVEKRDRAFKNYLTRGMARLGDEDRATLLEYRDMGTGGQGAYPGATSGFFVPVGFVDRIERAMKYYGRMLESSTIMTTTTGNPLPYPTSNDTAVVGELVGEGQQVTTNDVAIGSIILGAWKYSTKMVKVSIELLQDSAFDIEDFLLTNFAERMGRILNSHATIGTGSSQPNGIVTAATLGATAVGSSVNDGTSASTNTIGSDDLINLEHSVDPLYRPGASYMMHDQTLRQIKTIKDKYGRPLWLPGLAVQSPDTINGYPFFINNDLDQLQATPSSPQVTRKTVLYGALKKYLIRRVREMTLLRLEERFADYGQVAFIGFARGDSNLLDAGTHPVKYLQNVY